MLGKLMNLSTGRHPRIQLSPPGIDLATDTGSFINHYRGAELPTVGEVQQWLLVKQQNKLHFNMRADNANVAATRATYIPQYVVEPNLPQDDGTRITSLLWPPAEVTH